MQKLIAASLSYSSKVTDVSLLLLHPNTSAEQMPNLTSMTVLLEWMSLQTGAARVEIHEISHSRNTWNIGD